MRALAVGVAAAALSACASHGPRPVVATQEIAGDFLLAQHLRVTGPGGVTELDAVVQNACGELVVMMLTPFHTPALVIRQRGLRVEVDARAGMPLPFGPESILVDLHRTYFVPIGAPPADGRREVAWRGERIEETWQGARLRERTYLGGGDSEAGRLRVTYPDGLRPGELPPRASLESETLGYRIDVATVSRTEIACTP